MWRNDHEVYGYRNGGSGACRIRVTHVFTFYIRFVGRLGSYRTLCQDGRPTSAPTGIYSKIRHRLRRRASDPGLGFEDHIGGLQTG